MNNTSDSKQPQESDLIYDWNEIGTNPLSLRTKPIFLEDETLRDGLQSPSAKRPTSKQKVELLRLMEQLGIHSVNIGLPGSGPQEREDIDALLGAIVSERMRIKPGVAVRTHIEDIEPICELKKKHGIPIKANAFIAVSPIRQYVQQEDIDDIEEKMEESLRFAAENGIPVMFVTEDTTRSRPNDIERLYNRAIEMGVESICLCDTCGHATPHGVKELVTFVLERIVKPSGRDVPINWHGHCDRGLALMNALAAIEAGADVIHGTALGLGERAGNTQMDQLLVNLSLMGLFQIDGEVLKEYIYKAHDYTGAPLPENYPVFGADAFVTATGIHADAIRKARGRRIAGLADRVYSGVAASDFGLTQRIAVGPMSGRSNVTEWLEKNNYEVTEARVKRLLDTVKDSKDRERKALFSDDELASLIADESN
jgi:2-isopropylmalate synthase